MFASSALADANAGLALGLRSGYALPSGKLGSLDAKTPADDLADNAKGMVPLWLDVGYRISPSLYAGASFQYAVGFVNKDKAGKVCEANDCSVHDVGFGANVHYHVLPATSFDPWIGAGFGYEMFTDTVKGPGAGPTVGKTVEVSATGKGFQFLVLQLGGDFRPSPEVSVGPFVNVTVGKFTTYSLTGKLDGNTTVERNGDLSNTDLYEWFTFGLRVQFNL